ncbi:MAG: FG-GAP-like repeat-containing protein [Pyrinomonadaceae bacterium]
MRIRVLLKLKFSFVIISFFILMLGMSDSVFAQKVRLRAQLDPISRMTPLPSCASSNLKYADIFADGNIAVQGSYNCRGVFIYDISNPDAPVLSSWYNPGNNQQFLEAIVIGNRGYFGSGNGGGVHIVDLTNPANPVLLGTVSTANNAFSSIHEMVVFRQNNQDYLIENFNGFSSKILKVINVSNPASPVFIRDLNPTETAWVHAVHIRGNRMFTSGWGSASNRGRTEIYDISNIGTQAPSLLGFIEDQTSTTAGNSMHSSWSSEDGNYLYSCRETSNGNGDVRVYNITNPAVPLLVKSIGMVALGLNAVTPHNPVVMGNYLYVAWYQAGIQVFDLTNPADPKRVGQYDTFQSTFAAPVDERKKGVLETEPWDMVCGTTGRQNALPTTYDGNWAVFPFAGQNKILAGDLKNGLIILDASQVSAPLKNQVSDFDGDGKTDFSVYSPSTGMWQIENSSTGAFNTTHFGISEDKLVTGDYDGDGKEDIAVFRPSTGIWYILNSSTGFFAQQFGLTGDVPVAGDYDADGKTDFAVFRPSNGLWYIQQSSLGVRIINWGLSGDKAFSGDFEGDGKADLVIYRPSTGIWYISLSSSSQALIVWYGISTDKPVTADFDGDGKSEFAVYRPSEGNWYILNLATNSSAVYRFGLAEDMPIPADYDGDGKADIAVFRPSNNAWYRLNSSNGAFSARVFGQSGDTPSPASVQP